MSMNSFIETLQARLFPMLSSLISSSPPMKLFSVSQFEYMYSMIVGQLYMYSVVFGNLHFVYVSFCPCYMYSCTCMSHLLVSCITVCPCYCLVFVITLSMLCPPCVHATQFAQLMTVSSSLYSGGWLLSMRHTDSRTGTVNYWKN